MFTGWFLDFSIQDKMYLFKFQSSVVLTPILHSF